jgi:hypothetical protein
MRGPLPAGVRIAVVDIGAQIATAAQGGREGRVAEGIVEDTAAVGTVAAGIGTEAAVEVAAAVGR